MAAQQGIPLAAAGHFPIPMENVLGSPAAERMVELVLASEDAVIKLIMTEISPEGFNGYGQLSIGWRLKATRLVPKLALPEWKLEFPL